MKKKKKQHCWALAAFRTRRKGQGVGISSGVPIAFWDGRKWVKRPVSLACGTPMRTQMRVSDMPFKWKKGASGVGPVPMEMLIPLPGGKYDIKPEYSERGPKALRGASS